MAFVIKLDGKRWSNKIETAIYLSTCIGLELELKNKIYIQIGTT